MSKFQIALLVIFGVFIIAGVMVFSLYRGGGAQSATVTLWGDLPAYNFEIFLNETGLNQDRNLSIRYVEKSPETIYSEFTEALAVGQGPDLIMVTDSSFWKERDKLIVIPLRSVSERDFKETFVEASEIFLTSEGSYALPILIDPLVLYYSRDLLSSAGIARPLAYWDELFNTALTLSQKDPAGNIVRSAFALGEASNIPNFKSNLALLFLQAGTSIVAPSSSGLSSALLQRFDLPVLPAESALDFYTQFANPTRAYYSWNRSLLDAQTHFASGDSAYYLGFASEFATLRAKNPTLNFATTLVPQSRTSARNITLAQVRGVAIARGSRQPTSALEALVKLTSGENSLALSRSFLLPSPRRDILEVRPTDATFSVFYDSALFARTWLDPDREATRAIFREMIESVTSGRARSSEAVGRASRELDNLLR